MTNIIDDPWKDRKEHMRCKTCVFFVLKTSSSSEKDIGRCRRNAPTMNGFPVVFENDWCGNHRLDENKI